MKDDSIKIIRDRFAPWNYKAEASQLDELSKQGWQLSARKIWKMEFEFHPGVQYRYAIDFRRGHDEARYLDTFGDMGWELVGTIGDAGPFLAVWGGGLAFTPFAPHDEGCWYFFRKVYDPNEPEDAYSIESGSEALAESRKRMARNSTILAVLWAVCIPLSILNVSQALFAAQYAQYGTAAYRVLDIIYVCLSLASSLLLAGLFLYRRHLILHPRQTKSRFRMWPAFALWFIATNALAHARLVALIQSADLPGSIYYLPLSLALLSAVILAAIMLLRRRIWSRAKLHRLGMGLALFPLTVFLVSFLLIMGLEVSRITAADMPVITEDNTPAKLFAVLTPETTIGEVQAMTARSGWENWGPKHTGNLRHMNEYEYTVTVAGESGTYAFHQEQNGVVVKLYFYDSMVEGYEADAPEGVEQYDLIYARLTIKTDKGTATCFYYPTSWTEYGREQGFTVATKAAWYMPEKTHRTETAQEALDIAYAAVYGE